MMNSITMPDASFTPIQWHDAFAEGEKRIKENILDTLIKTPAGDRSRLMAQREIVQKKIARALEENDSNKLKLAFKAQVALLAKMSEIS